MLPEPGSGRLRPVGAGKIARQKLTYRVLGSAFHDGTRMNAADLLYSYMFAYRWGARGDGDELALRSVDRCRHRGHARAPRWACAWSAPTPPRNRSAFGDFEFVRELLRGRSLHLGSPAGAGAGCDRRAALEHAALASPGADGGGRRARLGGVLASEARPARRRVARSRPLREHERAACRACRKPSSATATVPIACKSLVSAEDARKRWAALAAFYQEHGHFLVTNGPYQLKRWSADSVTLEAFRDLSYPLGVGSYDAYAVPRRGFITKIERDGRPDQTCSATSSSSKSTCAATTSCAGRCNRIARRRAQALGSGMSLSS